MIDGKTFRHGLDKFFKSPVCQGARVQIELPNGEFYDITGAKLLENKIIGSKEQTHRLVLKGVKTKRLKWERSLKNNLAQRLPT